MVMLKQVLVGLLATTAVAAVDIAVSSRGGNDTSGYRYGLLHEVRHHSPMKTVDQPDENVLTD